MLAARRRMIISSDTLLPLEVGLGVLLMLWGYYSTFWGRGGGICWLGLGWHR